MEDRWRQFYAVRLLFGTAQALKSPSARPGLAGGLVAALLIAVHALRAIPNPPFWVHDALSPLHLHWAALRPSEVLQGEWSRLAMSTIVHLDVVHLIYNLCSFAGFAARMERVFGMAQFGGLLVYLGIVGSIIYVGISVVFAWVLGNYRFYHGAVAGFSGVVFGLMTVSSGYPALRLGTEYFFGVHIPGHLRHWKELVLCQILIPESSFLGHLCGILAGLSFLRLRTFTHSVLRGRSHND